MSTSTESQRPTRPAPPERRTPYWQIIVAAGIVCILAAALVGALTRNADLAEDATQSIAAKSDQVTGGVQTACARGQITGQLCVHAGELRQQAAEAKGDTGAAGASGPQGPAGPSGAAGPRGATGVAGPQGAAGPQGSTGPTGARGVTGGAGAAGAGGSPGKDGGAGPQGPAGTPGKDGAAGQDGAPGATGPQGPKGDTGPTGPPCPDGYHQTDALITQTDGTQAPGVACIADPPPQGGG